MVIDTDILIDHFHSHKAATNDNQGPGYTGLFTHICADDPANAGRDAHRPGRSRL